MEFKTGPLDSRLEKALTEPYAYLTEKRGKEIRSKMVEAFQTWLKVEEGPLETIKEVVEMLHTASLLIDDVEDDSKLRRGLPVAHAIYGIATTINCANYIYFKALSKILEINSPEAVKVFTEELICLHQGQGLDIYWRDTNNCPSEDEYLLMVSNKTGGLLRLAVKLMQAFSENKTDLIPLVNIVGILYQIRDDYINLCSECYMTTKTFCEDLTEGKFSFPIIHSIKADAGKNTQLQHILKQRTEDADIKRYAVECMRRTRSFEYTEQYLRRVEQHARDEIGRLGGNAALSGILDYLSKVYSERENGRIAEASAMS